MSIIKFLNTRDNRFKLWEEDKQFEFFSIEKKAPWEGSKRVMNQNVSSDGGKTFGYKQEQILFGTYFFLDDDMITINRSVYNILDLFSNVGGLLSLLRVVFSVVGLEIGQEAIIGTIIKHLYFIQDNLKFHKIHINIYNYFFCLK